MESSKTVANTLKFHKKGYINIVPFFQISAFYRVLKNVITLLQMFANSYKEK